MSSLLDLATHMAESSHDGSYSANELGLLEQLTDLAFLARQAGVVPEIEDLFNHFEREAWVAAGKRLEIERAQAVGIANRDYGVELLQSELDGGHALGESIVSEAASRVAGNMALESRHAN